MKIINFREQFIKSKIAICAIILNYLGYSDTIDCVNTLIQQKISRIVILENSGSAVEKRKLNEAFGHISHVDVTPSRTNLGFSGGVNYVLRQMLPLQFDAFLIVNNDILAPPNLIENLIKAVYTESLDLAAPLIYHYPEKHLLWSQGNFYNPIFGIERNSPIFCLPRNVFYLTGCCLFVRKKVFDTVGLFDESFFIYGEDVEFCYRANKNGFRIGVVKDAQIYHRVNASSQNNSLFYEYYINRGHFILSKKLSHSKSEYMAFFPMKLLIMGIRALVRTIRYRNLNALRGYFMAALHPMYRRLKILCNTTAWS
ncbi:MAG: glycosyltransferase family 2 protein [Candidatus Omnitrophica bacterium]|nr:glycosyltransferase family 2 protein [Candidatus Omnitrophota bacterium]